MAYFKFSSIFGELTKNTQIRFDAVTRLNKSLVDNVIIERFLDWDVPTVGLNFDEIIGQYNVSIAAPTIGDNSKEPIMGTEGLQTMAGKVFNHALSKPMTIQTYRKVLQILDSKSITDDAKKQQLINLMWGDVTSVVSAVYGKLDMIFLQAISNEGVATLDGTTNPEGIPVTIDYKQPAANVATSTGGDEWTDANIATVDCFEQIMSIVDTASEKVKFGKILISPALFSYFCRATKTRQLIHGTKDSSKIVQLSDVNSYMQSNDLPTFEVIRRQVRIQDGTSRTPYTPFNGKNLVFIPDGKLGVIKNAYANNELRPEPNVAYSNYGRIRVSQWGVGETQGSNGVEFTKAESLSVPLITEMNGIYTLKAKS